MPISRDPPPFLPLNRDDYPPISDHGLIGDGSTAALVARDGSVNFMCVPRFDSEPLFCALLDSGRGGRFQLLPEGALESRQFYLQDTPLLQTEIRCGHGLLRITDACTMVDGADLGGEARLAQHELLRRVEVLQGSPRLHVAFQPRGGARARREPDQAMRIEAAALPGITLRLRCSRTLENLDCTLPLHEGEEIWFSLRWSDTRADLDTAGARLQGTFETWQHWLQRLHYDGPQAPLVRRSAVVLQLLDHAPNGAIVASPTSSLPERVGGSRNWDYRYTWIRDAAFAVYAMRRIGLQREGRYFLNWVMNVMARSGEPSVLYTLDGEVPGTERVDDTLEGYRGSRPVRWGNAAALQKQNDIYGEVLDCAWQWANGSAPDALLWKRLSAFADTAASVWKQPDQGIWEVRSKGRVHTYSAALCHVALDRACRMAQRHALPADIGRWSAAAADICAAITEQAWNERRRALCASLGGSELDASVLSLPLRRVLPFTHPRMVETTGAVARELGAGKGLVYRYLPDRLPDGLQQHEGAFLLCSFWLVDNYAGQGRMDEALALYDEACSHASPLGLLPEQIDPASGDFLGNFPLGLSHVGVISSGVGLQRRLAENAPPAQA